jgi:hypothetical protein
LGTLRRLCFSIAFKYGLFVSIVSAPPGAGDWTIQSKHFSADREKRAKQKPSKTVFIADRSKRPAKHRNPSNPNKKPPAAQASKQGIMT